MFASSRGESAMSSTSHSSYNEESSRASTPINAAKGGIIASPTPQRPEADIDSLYNLPKDYTKVPIPNRQKGPYRHLDVHASSKSSTGEYALESLAHRDTPQDSTGPPQKRTKSAPIKRSTPKASLPESYIKLDGYDEDICGKQQTQYQSYNYASSQTTTPSATSTKGSNRTLPCRSKTRANNTTPFESLPITKPTIRLKRIMEVVPQNPSSMLPVSNHKGWTTTEDSFKLNPKRIRLTRTTLDKLSALRLLPSSDDHQAAGSDRTSEFGTSLQQDTVIQPDLPRPRSIHEITAHGISLPSDPDAAETPKISLETNIDITQNPSLNLDCREPSINEAAALGSTLRAETTAKLRQKNAIKDSHMLPMMRSHNLLSCTSSAVSPGCELQASNISANNRVSITNPADMEDYISHPSHVYSAVALVSSEESPLSSQSPTELKILNLNGHGRPLSEIAKAVHADDFDNDLDDEDLLEILSNFNEPSTQSNVRSSLLNDANPISRLADSHTEAKVTKVQSRFVAQSCASLNSFGENISDSNWQYPSAKTIKSDIHDQYSTSAEEMLQLSKLDLDFTKTLQTSEGVIASPEDRPTSDDVDRILHYPTSKSRNSGNTPPKSQAGHDTDKTSTEPFLKQCKDKEKTLLDDGIDGSVMLSPCHVRSWLAQLIPPSTIVEGNSVGDLSQVSSLRLSDRHVTHSETTNTLRPASPKAPAFRARSPPKQSPSSNIRVAPVNRSAIDDSHDEYEPLKAFARPAFPNPVTERCPVVGLSSQTVLRTCFRIGEMLKEGARLNVLGQDAVIELFARVICSSREAGTTRQHFQFADLWHDRPPFPTGTLLNYESTGLAGNESKIFLDTDERKMARCFGRLKRDSTNTIGWRLHIMSIRETDWEEIRWTKRILTAGVSKSQVT